MCTCRFSLVVEHLACNQKVAGSIPAGGFCDTAFRGYVCWRIEYRDGDILHIDLSHAAIAQR